MKVEVLTLEDVSIKRWRWWSNWIDVAVFSHGYQGFLLQMKVSRRNAKSFRARRLNGGPNLASVDAVQVGDLVQMGGQT